MSKELRNQDSREQLSLGGLFAAEREEISKISSVLGSNQMTGDLSKSDPAPKEKIIEVSPPKPPEPKELAPMLQHYVETKRKYPEHLLLFQVGDFYEIFFEDAHKASGILNIRLTSRNKDDPDAIPMCGVPIHALDNYLPKLLRAGVSCVLMSQVEDSKGKKGGVSREISRIVTPGIRFEGDGLDEKSFNFLLAVSFSSRGAGALSFSDVSTGVLRVVEVESVDELLDMIQRVSPSEIVLPSVVDSIPVEKDEVWVRRVRAYGEETGVRVLFRPFERMKRESMSQRLEKLLSGAVPPFVSALGQEALSAVTALLDYVDDVSFGNTPMLSEFSFLESGQGLVLDAATRRNLELTETRIDGERRNSLLNRIDYTRTAMGARQLGEWLLSPSTKREEIQARHGAVEELIAQVDCLEAFREVLLGVRDIDRLVSRITTRRAMPSDLGALRDSLRNLPKFAEYMKRCHSVLFEELAGRFDVLHDVWERLDEVLVDEPPIKLVDGGIVRKGVHSELDRLKKLAEEGSSWLVELEQRERQATSIPSLKVKYNNVFGYFIEISKAHQEKAPAHYERRQTLVNAERFVTKELKEFEQEVLSARSRQIDLEREIFTELRNWVAENVARLQRSARVISTIDVLCSYAYAARKHAYIRPELREDGMLKIVGGRHPVVEQVLGQQNFIPNDVRLDGEKRRFAVLTGPNMGGKSTYLRQVGLIQLLAQAGSFVPATSAELTLVDRIFTRIGAADDLARGDSTFMMEMREAAIISKKATARSLVLVDELGRGTATTDGLAIAWAIAEWLHDVIRCKSVFATHFHELNDLVANRDGVFCLSVGVVEHADSVVFTHRIEEEAAMRSYGLEVAELAGLPTALLVRAREVFEELGQREKQQVAHLPKREGAVGFSPEKEKKLLAFETLGERIAGLQINSLTPLQAMMELEKLQSLLPKNR